MSNNSFVAQALDGHMPSFQQRLYNLFANYNNYSSFSNEAWIPSDNNGTYDSVESLHDSIHTLGGGNFGHLSIIQYSAFDPLFMLHHVNVDRIFAMWQVLYNDSYVEPMPAVYPSHTTSAGEVQDIGTPLTPFYANETTFWTSETARDYEVFGYTYAEVATKNRTELITSINRLYTHYSPAIMPMTMKRRRRRSAGYGDVMVTDHNVLQQGLRRRLSRIPMKALFDGDDYYEWIANVHVRKQALNGSFEVHLFLGDAPPDPSIWSVASNLVGTLGVFAHNGPHGTMSTPQVAGTIPMTSMLMDAIADGGVASLQPSHVGPFLKSKLTVRVSLLTGRVVDPKKVDGLGISIISSRVTAPASEDSLAHWGEVTSQFDLVI